MASSSSSCSQSSSVAQDHESPVKTAESPIIPVSEAETIGNSSPKSVIPNTMADADAAAPKPSGSRSQLKTPEPRLSKERMNGHKDGAERSPSTPGYLAPFDWEEFEARYEEALADADRQERELLQEFEDLVKFFNVWASAASVHDTERGVKRLQTRERYVKIAEQSLSQKKKHLSEVVRAFQSALALLSQT
ncbi:hypothetical protein MYCTH_2296236 [Thermothelomyces thermophilus ATCC 42464]|uniref:Uncharacterized protein n=1 Tax=Thermothelomyces thermophilus (strain ATCC 42464 / BCRC 31852 / DSM 1799) TaxID=573729 RepID=G2Q0Z7_THET4|nr:uncharacterized protein MYCTH_2296236 [Thermothelomyces thermophilus ATCC 42464]AEO54095.1 hypothetical protein MYCTH_2296236 [Thermothelomyces thermophilus ATCC 42464]